MARRRSVRSAALVLGRALVLAALVALALAPALVLGALALALGLGLVLAALVLVLVLVPALVLVALVLLVWSMLLGFRACPLRRCVGLGAWTARAPRMPLSSC